MSGTVQLVGKDATGKATLVKVDTTGNLQVVASTDAIYADDADWAANNSKHNLIGGVYQSSPGTITDGDTGPLRLTTNGAAHVEIKGGNITGFATSENQATTNSKLDDIISDTASIDSKITACDTGSVAIATSALPTGAATSANQTAGNGFLEIIKNAVGSSDGTSIQLPSQAMLIGGKSASVFMPIKVDTNGVLAVSAPIYTTEGTTLNDGSTTINNNATFISKDTSKNGYDVGEAKKIVVFGTLTDTSDGPIAGDIKVEIAITDGSDSDYYETDEYPIVVNSGRFAKTIDVETRYIRFKYTNESGAESKLKMFMSYKR